MSAVEARVAVLVGLGRDYLRDAEGLRRQVGHGHAVLHEQLALGLPFEVMVLAGAIQAPAEDPLVVGGQAVDAGNGDEQVAPDGPDGILHGALLVAGVGVAEGEVEPVVGGEARERVGGADNLADPSADARGVVKHQPGGHAPAELEHGLQALADAFRRLAPEALRQRHVGEREGDHQVVHLAHDAQHPEVAHAEVDLPLAGRPFEVEELVFGAFELGFALLDVGLDDCVAAVVAAFRDEPVEYPLGRVSLLGAPLPVLRKPTIYRRLERVKLRTAPLPGLDLRGEVVHVAVFAHRGLGDSLLPGYLGDAVATGSALLDC